jgi:voltage-gated potassium channel
MNPFRKVRLLLLVLLGIFATGTAGYMLLEGWSFLDSLYMTVITLATVGYGEVQELSRIGELFTILLITLGVGTVSFTAFTIAQSLLEGQLRSILGRRQLERQIQALSGHYIICGFGRIGSELTRQLTDNGLSVLVVEINDHKLQRLAASDYLFMNGDATSEKVLEEAGIGRAKGLVTTVASDAENLFITLTAREMNPDLFILARAFDVSSEAKLRRAGADRVVAPTSIGAQRMAQFILRPAVVELMELATYRESLDLQLEEVRVHSGSALVDVALRDTDIRSGMGVIVLSMNRADGSMVFNPPSEELIHEGDVLIAIGRPEGLAQLERAAGAPVVA